MESGFIYIDVKRFLQGKGQGRNAMIECHSLNEERGFLEHRKNL